LTPSFDPCSQGFIKAGEKGRWLQVFYFFSLAHPFSFYFSDRLSSTRALKKAAIAIAAAQAKKAHLSPNRGAYATLLFFSIDAKEALKK
jgi:hypothetical protein